MKYTTQQLTLLGCKPVAFTNSNKVGVLYKGRALINFPSPVWHVMFPEPYQISWTTLLKEDPVLFFYALNAAVYN